MLFTTTLFIFLPLPHGQESDQPGNIRGLRRTAGGGQNGNSKFFARNSEYLRRDREDGAGPAVNALSPHF